MRVCDRGKDILRIVLIRSESSQPIVVAEIAKDLLSEHKKCT